MDTVDFKAEHLRELQDTGSQQYVSQYIAEASIATLENYESFSGIADGRVIACSGVVPIWNNRAMAWAYLADDIAKEFLHVHFAVLRFLKRCSYDRVEATVECNHVEGHTWIQALGFELEAPVMHKYLPNGAPCSLYSRIK